MIKRKTDEQIATENKLDENKAIEETKELKKDETLDLKESEETSEKVYDIDKDFVKQLDEQKKQYNKSMTLNRVLSIVVMIAVLVMATLIFTIWLKALGEVVSIILVVVCCVVLLVYNFVGKKLISKKAAKYIEAYYSILISHFLAFEGISEVNNTAKGKIDKQIFIDSRSYLDIVDTGSRNVTTFKYKEDKYTMAEVAAQIKGKKYLEAIFVGKLLYCDNKLNFPGRVLISVKGKNDLWKPVDDIQGLSVVGENKRFIIYSNYEKYRTILTREVITLIEGFYVNAHLFDVFISIQAGRTYVGLDLASDLMDIPTNKDYAAQPNEALGENIERAVKLIDAINNPTKGK